ESVKRFPRPSAMGVYQACHVPIDNGNLVTWRCWMLFLLSKFLNWFVYPLSLLFLRLDVVLIFYRRRYARQGLAFVLLLLYGLRPMVTVKPLMRWLEAPRAAAELRQHYDVAIVLTGMVNLRGSRPGHLEFTEHVERLLEGISLVKRG